MSHNEYYIKKHINHVSHDIDNVRLMSIGQVFYTEGKESCSYDRLLNKLSYHANQIKQYYIN